MFSSLPTTIAELDTLEKTIDQLRQLRDFDSTMDFCEHVRRFFFTAHGRLLLAGEQIDAQVHDRFSQLMEEGLTILDEMIATETVNKSRMQGYRHSIMFRLECMKILVFSGEQKAFEKLAFGVYMGELKPVGATLEENLLRQFAHLQWELEHEQGPFVEASKVFVNITEPYRAMLQQFPAETPLHLKLRTKLDLLMALLGKAAASGGDDPERQAKALLRQAAMLIHNLVAPEVEADPNRAKRAFEDHMALLGNEEWVKQYQGKIVAIGVESGERSVVGAGTNPHEALEQAKQRDPGLSMHQLTFVEVPKLMV